MENFKSCWKKIAHPVTAEIPDTAGEGGISALWGCEIADGSKELRS